MSKKVTFDLPNSEDFDQESYKKALKEFINNIDINIRDIHNNIYNDIKLDNIDIENQTCTLLVDDDNYDMSDKYIYINKVLREIDRYKLSVDKINHICLCTEQKVKYDTIWDRLLITPSRRRYEKMMPNEIDKKFTKGNHGIMVYFNGGSNCHIKRPARVMLCITPEHFATICITKHFVFPLCPINWLFNIKKDLDFITKHKDIFFKYWENIDIYGNEIGHILYLMDDRSISEEEAVKITKQEYYE